MDGRSQTCGRERPSICISVKPIFYNPGVSWEGIRSNRVFFTSLFSFVSHEGSLSLACLRRFVFSLAPTTKKSLTMQSLSYKQERLSEVPRWRLCNTPWSKSCCCLFQSVSTSGLLLEEEKAQSFFS
jgi:hypothetical protein